MSSDKNKATNNQNDKELNDLLDSALQDFEKSSETKSTDKTDDSKQETEAWNDEFIDEQVKLFNETMNSIFGGAANQGASPDEIKLGFEKMAESAAAALQQGGIAVEDSSQNYTERISHALSNLKENLDDLQAPEPDIANMLSSLSFGDIEGENSDSNPFLPFMQGMLQKLLSSELMLSTMKDVLEKYPKYFEENGDKITAEEKERYLKQQELFKTIVDDLEAEKPDDSPEVKQERFKRMLAFMQKMRDYGQPPEEILGERGPELPGFEGSPDNVQCPLM